MITLDEARTQLKAVPRFSSSWRAAIISEQDASWFGVVWTRVVLLLAGETIEYVGGRLRSGDGGPIGELHVFSQTRLIRATVGGSDDDELEVAVWAVDRRDVQRVAATGGNSIFGPESSEDWPGRVGLLAVYPDDMVELPGDGVSDSQMTRFLEFAPSLIADLHAGRGGTRHASI